VGAGATTAWIRGDCVGVGGTRMRRLERTYSLHTYVAAVMTKWSVLESS
jgi:hypothetical protein